jgi:integrase
MKLPTTNAGDRSAALLEAADPYMRIAILLGLKCGMRDQEMMQAEFEAVDHEARVIRVRSKPEFGFKVKKSEERDITLRDDVYTELVAWCKEG